MTPLDKFIAARVTEDGDCLRWTGYCFNGSPGGTLNGKKFLIRRAMLEQEHGTIPKGRVIRCTCRTPLCVTRDHFKLTTYKAIAQECGALGLMSGPVRSAKIAAAKRAGPQAKITQEDARALFLGDESPTAFAARHNIAVSTACRIKRGEVRRDFGGNPWAGLLPQGSHA